MALKQSFGAAKAIIASRSSLIEKVVDTVERKKVEQLLTTQLFTNQKCGIATAIHEVLGVPILWVDDKHEDSQEEGNDADHVLEKKLDLEKMPKLMRFLKNILDQKQKPLIIHLVH